ncbi:zinc ribbon domain-containing protein [Aliifodinibius salicampi]|uniref:Zinc ribbon domain-containing protein n=1 Tax=Fodinibius salicampi TaxID=1920655 RepID=A0ABT3Q208_9BACT|nr:zinc ribbon domain-containing protein [Fodinibius salicampi]MCW9714147.1 zinc ribbon domain-containing protein [Fodinibius salicampi]
MKKKECPGCAMEVDADSDICPICGYEFPSQPLSIQIMAWVMAILLLLWLVF